MGYHLITIEFPDAKHRKMVREIMREAGRAGPDGRRRKVVCLSEDDWRRVSLILYQMDPPPESDEFRVSAAEALSGEIDALLHYGENLDDPEVAEIEREACIRWPLKPRLASRGWIGGCDREQGDCLGGLGI